MVSPTELFKAISPLESFVQVTSELDDAQADLSYQCRKNTVNQRFLEDLIVKINISYSVFKQSFPLQDREHEKYAFHIENKFVRINEKITSLCQRASAVYVDCGPAQASGSDLLKRASRIHPSFYAQILDYSHQLDRIRSTLEDQLEKGTASAESIMMAQRESHDCFTQYLKTVFSQGIGDFSEKYLNLMQWTRSLQLSGIGKT